MRSAFDELATILRVTEAKDCGSGQSRAHCLCDPGRSTPLSIKQTPTGWMHYCHKGGCSRQHFCARVGLRSTRRPLQRPQPYTPIYRAVLPQASRDALARFERLPVATTHAYLRAKGIPPVAGLRLDGDDLVAPMYDDAGVLRNLQRVIERRGGLVRGGRLPSTFEKRFLKGAPTRGLYFVVGKPTRRLHIAEGIASAISTHVLTSELTLCAFSVANLAAVAVLAVRKYGARQIVIAADHDGKEAA